MNRSALLLFCFTTLIATLRAQLPQYQAQVFGEEQGIGGGIVQDVFTDREQFLWVMTPSVLQRFDGRNVQRYPFSGYVSQGMCAADGRIWAVAGRAVWRNRTDWKGFEQMPLDTSGGRRPRVIFQIQNGPVTVLTDKGLYAWDEASAQFKRLELEILVPTARQHAMRIDTSGGILFYGAGDSCICALDVATGQRRTLPFKREYRHLMALTPDLAILSDYLGNSYWYDFGRGEVRPIDARRYGLSRDFHKINIQGVIRLPNGRFLVSTQWGPCEYDLQQDVFTPERIFSAGKPIENEKDMQRFSLDESGTIWGHTVTNVVAIKPVAHSFGLLRNYHFTPPYQWDDRVFGSAEDDAGNIWFSGQFGFEKLDLHSGNITAYQSTEGATDRLSHPFVRSVLWDGRYLLLGPTYNGVWLFEPQTGRYRRPVYVRDTVRKRLEGEYIDYMATMRNGDHLVCGRGSPYRIEAHTYRTDFLDFPQSDANMNFVVQDSAGRVWFGSQRAIHCLDEQYHFLFNVSMPAGGSVYCIFQIDAHDWLIGTEKGLHHLLLRSDGPQLGPLLTDLKDVAVKTIFRDRLGRFWIGSYDGLYLADAALHTFVKFDFSDNIQSRVFNQGACLLAKNGMLFLGGQHGINYFIPENIALEDHPLAVSLQSMRIDDADSVIFCPAEQAGPFRLPHYWNTLAFEIVAPYFNNAGKLRYRYRLSGRSDNWVELGTNNTFRLAELPAGNYRLEVAASLSGQTWYTAKSALIFSVLPPFWASWSFLIIAYLVLLGLVIFFIRFRENQLKRQQQSQLEVEKLKGTALQYQLETEQVANYFHRSISAKSTVDEALWDVAQQCIARLGWEDCVIYLLDPERRVLVQKAAWGQKSTPDQKIVSPIEIALGEGIVGTVALTGQAELVTDTASDPRYIVDNATRASELAVPMLVEGRVFGVIDSEHSQKGFYTAWHLQLLTAIASLCSSKIVVAQTEEARRQALLEALDNQRKAAEAKLQSLRLQMNPHFLFNALNSIQQLILYGNTDGAALYLSKFSKLLRMVLIHSDRDFIHLREELDILHLYLELEALRFEDNFTYTIDCPPDLDKDDYQVPPLLIQPFVENAIWHGLMHKEGARRLYIRFDTDADDRLLCTIEDNGVGRKAAHSHVRNDHHSGKGVGVGAERIETINRQYKQRNTLAIIDLEEGTRIEILFQ